MRPSAIVLAGGKEAWAERFGVGSKALVPYRGRPMVEWVLEALYAAGLSPVYVGENPGLVPAPALTLNDNHLFTFDTMENIKAQQALRIGLRRNAHIKTSRGYGACRRAPNSQNWTVQLT